MLRKNHLVIYLAKITAKKFKKKQLSKADISDFKLECSEMFLIKFIFQAKIPSCSGVYTNKEGQKYTTPSPPLSKDEGLKDIEHSRSIENLILGFNSIMVSYLIRYDSLLQNATYIITKYVRLFITKCNSFIIKFDRYYKIQRLS